MLMKMSWLMVSGLTMVRIHNQSKKIGLQDQNYLDQFLDPFIYAFLFKDNIVEYSTESKPDRLKELQTFTESALKKDKEDATENTLTTTTTEKSNQLGIMIRNAKVHPNIIPTIIVV